MKQFSKTTSSNSIEKIIKMVSREEQFARNGGGQWVSTNKAHKSKKDYSRQAFKSETKKIKDGEY